MSSSFNSYFFEFRWYYSRYLLGFYILCYLLALFVAIHLPINYFKRMLLMIAVSVYVLFGLLKHVLFMLPTSLIALRRNSTDWFVLTHNLAWREIQLLPASCVVLPAIIVLRFRIPGEFKTSTLCLPCDSLSASEHRKLRVYLRYLMNPKPNR